VDQDHTDLTSGRLELEDDMGVDRQGRGRSHADLAMWRLHRDQTLRGPAHHNALHDGAGDKTRQARRG
jgi:hypothetical protein